MQGAGRRAVKYTTHRDADVFRETVLKRRERKRCSLAADRSRMPGPRSGDKAVARRCLRWKSKAARKFYETRIWPGGARAPLGRWLCLGSSVERLASGVLQELSIVAVTTVIQPPGKCSPCSDVLLSLQSREKEPMGGVAEGRETTDRTSPPLSEGGGTGVSNSRTEPTHSLCLCLP